MREAERAAFKNFQTVQIHFDIADQPAAAGKDCERLSRRKFMTQHLLRKHHTNLLSLDRVNIESVQANRKI